MANDCEESRADKFSKRLRRHDTVFQFMFIHFPSALSYWFVCLFNIFHRMSYVRHLFKTPSNVETTAGKIDSGRETLERKPENHFSFSPCDVPWGNEIG